MLEEKAKRFFLGQSISESDDNLSNTKSENASVEMTKEVFTQRVKDFVDKKGSLQKVDFSREYNHLPSICYVRKYYGDLFTLKKELGIEDLSYSWNRDTIKTALEKYIDVNGDLFQKDLTKKNNLPSLPCILRYYPEYNNFVDIKRDLCKLNVPEKWTVESAIKAGKEYVSKFGTITQPCLNSKNHLPSNAVVQNLFGSLPAYQQAVGSDVPGRNEFISKDDIEKAVIQYFGDQERIIESSKAFYKEFPISPSTIGKRFGSFSSFCKEYDITVLNYRKAKYSKSEVDEAIAKWVKSENTIPKAKDLYKLGLPSMSVILKYYEDWKEPFILYQKLYDRLNLE